MIDLSRIRTLCEKNYISLKKLASDIGVSEQTIHLMLRQNTTKLSTLDEIARYFNVNVEYFLHTEQEEREAFINALNASVKYDNEYDIKLLFKVEEEALLKDSADLRAFINRTTILDNKDSPIDSSISFTRSMLDHSIMNLFYTMQYFPIEALKELEQICDTILNQLYDKLRDETIKPFIREELFSPKDIDILLKTYFLKDSVLLKPKIWLIKNQAKNS